MFTTPGDVESRLGRSLSDDELELTLVLVDDAEQMIGVRAPGGSVATLDPYLVKRVAASAVVRVLRNPDGYRSESAGAVSYTIDSRAAAGFLTILDDEWAMLGLSPLSRGGAGSFGPSFGSPPSAPLGNWW